MPSGRLQLAVQAVVRHALARGYLTREQLREALLLQDQLLQSGRAVELLPLLRARFLPPESLTELTAVYQQSHRPGSDSSSGSDRIVGATLPLRPAGEIPADLLERSSELVQRPAAEDPAHVQAFLRESGEGRLAPVDETARDTLRDGPAARVPTGNTTVRRVVLPERIGRYRVVRELARGGMGVVYRAHSETLDRPVALKVMRAGLDEQEDLDRFLAEARAAARLRHPNIVGVHEVGEDGGQYFIAMDLIEGRSLKDRLRSGGELPGQRRAAEVVADIADALAYAHQRSILHRDVKPANILIDHQGQPWITDFGLAKDVTEERGLTVTGQILGTPAYMSPEQAMAENDRVDARSDVYSLGATLYEALSGRPPFVGESPLVVMQKAVNDDPLPLSSLCAELDRDLEAICLKCMQKAPRDRYRTAVDLRDDLRRYLAGESIEARLPTLFDRARRWTRRNGRAIGAAAIVVLALLGVGVVAYTQGVGARAEQEREQQRARLDQLAGLLNRVEAGELQSEAELDGVVRELERAKEAGVDPVPLLVERLRVVREAAHEALHRAYLEAEVPTADEARAGASPIEQLPQALKAWVALPPGKQLPSGSLATMRAARERIERRMRLHGGSTDRHARLDDRIAVRQAEALGGGAAVAVVCCRALGLLGDAERGVPALASYLRVEHDPTRAKAPAIALCELGGSDAYRYVVRAMQRFHGATLFQGPVGRAFRRLRDTPAARSPDAFVARGRGKLRQRDWRGAEADASKAIDLAAHDARGWLLRGRARLQLRDLSRARSDVDRALKLAPDRVRCWLLLGQIEIEAGKYAAAEQAFTRAISRDAQEVRGWTLRSHVRVLRRELKGALADARQAVKVAPNDSGAYFQRGEVFHNQGNHRAAVRDFGRACELDPGDYSALCYRGVARHALGESAAALADVSRAVQMAPRVGTQAAFALASRGGILMERGELQQARKDIEEALRLDKNCLSAWNYLGVLLARVGEVMGARDAMERSLKLSPKRPLAWVNLAAIKQKLGDLGGALADIERALRIKPDLSFGLAKRGEIRASRGDLRGGVQDLTAALKREPKNAIYWVYLGDIYLQGKALDQAMAAFRKATELQPRLPDGWLRVALVAKRKQDFAGARRALDQGIARDPRSSQLYRERAKLRAITQDLPGAERDFAQALRINPKNRWAWAGRGTVRLAQGKRAQGNADLARAVADDPRSLVFWLDRSRTRALLGDLKGAIADANHAEGLAIDDSQRKKVWYERAMYRYKGRDLRGALADLERCAKVSPRDRKIQRAIQGVRGQLGRQP